MTRRRRPFPFPTFGMLLALVLAAAGVYGLGWLGLAALALAGKALGVRWCP